MIDRIVKWIRNHFGISESPSETEEHDLVRQVASLKSIAAVKQARVDRLTAEVRRVEAVVLGPSKGNR